jgi:hypothetical protein
MKEINLVLSCRHLTKVVWSWGRKGLSAIPPLLIMIERVDKIAALTCQGNLSPIILMRGLQKIYLERDINNKSRLCKKVQCILSLKFDFLQVILRAYERRHFIHAYT